MLMTSDNFVTFNSETLYTVHTLSYSIIGIHEARFKLEFRTIFTFCVSRRRPKCIVVTRVCVSVCLSVRGRTPTLLHGTGCNLGRVVEAAP